MDRFVKLTWLLALMVIIAPGVSFYGMGQQSGGRSPEQSSPIVESFDLYGGHWRASKTLEFDASRVSTERAGYLSRADLGLVRIRALDLDRFVGYVFADSLHGLGMRLNT